MATTTRQYIRDAQTAVNQASRLLGNLNAQIFGARDDTDETKKRPGRPRRSQLAAANGATTEGASTEGATTENRVGKMKASELPQLIAETCPDGVTRTQICAMAGWNTSTANINLPRLVKRGQLMQDGDIYRAPPAQAAATA